MNPGYGPLKGPVNAMVIFQDILFTGTADKLIKKWNLGVSRT